MSEYFCYVENKFEPTNQERQGLPAVKFMEHTKVRFKNLGPSVLRIDWYKYEEDENKVNIHENDLGRFAVAVGSTFCLEAKEFYLTYEESAGTPGIAIVEIDAL